jgi:hypothetical protein
MRRREFITLLGGAAAWPLDARAQQPGKPPTIGFLGTATPSGMSRWTAALAQRLGELGWIEGRTVAIEYRGAEGRPERYAEIAAEFVGRRVDVISAATGTATVAPRCGDPHRARSCSRWSSTRSAPVRAESGTVGQCDWVHDARTRYGGKRPELRQRDRPHGCGAAVL